VNFNHSLFIQIYKEQSSVNNRCNRWHLYFLQNITKCRRLYKHSRT